MPKPRRRAPVDGPPDLSPEELARAAALGESYGREVEREIEREDARSKVHKPVKSSQAAGARVQHRLVGAVPLVQVDLAAIGETSVHAAIVKVTADLRPSEREAFDAAAVRDVVLLRGAIAVVVASTVLPEAPDQEARHEVAKAPGPDDAIRAWFGGLHAPGSDRDAALELSLGMLAAEEGSR